MPTQEYKSRFHDHLEAACQDRGLAHDALWKGLKTPFHPNLRPLEKLGLLAKHGRFYKGKRQVWLGEGCTILTDRPDDRRLWRTFPVFSDESLVLANSALSDKGMLVLEIGTGSGILAILAALRGSRVFATDINARAILMARCNASLNGVRDRISFIFGDTFQGIPEERYDLILANPPFAPVPPGCPFHVSGNGGDDGLFVIRKILAQAGRYLSPDGSLVMLTMSVQRDGEPHVLELARNMMGPQFRLDFARVYDDDISIDEHCSLFKRWGACSTWRGTLRRKGFDSLVLGVLTATRGKFLGNRCRTFDGRSSYMSGGYSGNWSGRLRRYADWLSLFR